MLALELSRNAPNFWFRTLDNRPIQVIAPSAPNSRFAGRCCVAATALKHPRGQEKRSLLGAAAWRVGVRLGTIFQPGSTVLALPRSREWG